MAGKQSNYQHLLASNSTPALDDMYMYVGKYMYVVNCFEFRNEL